MMENLVNQAVEIVVNIDYATYALKGAFWIAEKGVKVVTWVINL